MKKLRVTIGVLVGLLLIIPLSLSGCGGVDQAAYDEVVAELEAIQQVYPLTGFDTLSEFKDWISDHVQPETTWVEDAFLAAYKVQQEAMEDGYLMGLDLDYNTDDTITVTLTTFVGNELYWWFVEDAEMYYGTDFFR